MYFTIVAGCSGLLLGDNYIVYPVPKDLMPRHVLANHHTNCQGGFERQVQNGDTSDSCLASTVGF